MKGKKFSAAEKHFEKLKERYLRTINSLSSENAELRKRLASLESENKTLADQTALYREMLGVESADRLVRQKAREEQLTALLCRLCVPFI